MHVLASQTNHHLLTMGIPIGEKVLRTLGIYVGLVVLLRVAGKRDLAQLNSFDLVVLLLLSNVVQNAVIGDDLSLTGGMLGAAVLVGVNAVVVRTLTRSDSLSRLVEGSETVLVRDGRLEHRRIKRLGLRDEDVVTALHRQGASTPSEVTRAVLTPGGTIDVTLDADGENATKGDLDRLRQELTTKLDALLAAQG